ncbi:MAG: cupredoxin domain-containing protein, partial [Nitrospirae bacterium]|nr:cupredoxin domain-containing protein [Nitrospirota bacterium]
MKTRFYVFALLLVFGATLGAGETTIKTTIRNQRFIPDEIRIKAETKVIFQISNEDKV